MDNYQLSIVNCQLPKGYKNTEVGVIPEDWEVKRLGEIATIIGGGTPSTNETSFWNGNINWFTPTEIGLKKYSDESVRKITKIGLENSSARLLPVGTILLTTRAGIGDISILMSEACTNQGFQSFVVNDGFDNEYIYYLISTLKNTFIQNASGSTFLEISPKKIKAIQIAIPTKTEQTAIATALSDADALINSLEKLIAKKRNIKQGAMQQLLKPKEGWEVKKLGEVGKCHRGVSYNPERDLHPHDKNITVRLLRSNNVQNQNIDLNGLQYVDQERVKQNQLLQDNDIVICMANGSKQLVGKSAIFKVKDKLNYTFGAFMGCFRTNADLASSSYIALNFQSFQYRNYIDVLLSGSSINNLNPGNIESIEIPFPSKEEQTRIATILSDMDAEIQALETKLEKYRKIKLGMMQNLLTGKIRLV